jgi:hypothetical protein
LIRESGVAVSVPTGMNRPVLVEAAMGFILTLFFGVRAALFR